jgi:hypothetical protein
MSLRHPDSADLQVARPWLLAHLLLLLLLSCPQLSTGSLEAGMTTCGGCLQTPLLLLLLQPHRQQPHHRSTLQTHLAAACSSC